LITSGACVLIVLIINYVIFVIIIGFIISIVDLIGQIF